MPTFFELRHKAIVSIVQHSKPFDIEKIHTISQVDLCTQDSGILLAMKLYSPLPSPLRSILEKIDAIAKPVEGVAAWLESAVKNPPYRFAVCSMITEYAGRIAHLLTRHVLPIDSNPHH